MRLGNDIERKRRYYYRTLSRSIALIIGSVVCIVILLKSEQFDHPGMALFKKIMLVILVIGLLPLSLLAAAAIYALHRSKKSRANIKAAFETLERCDFCERAIESSQTPYYVKDRMVCADCYARIEEEKENMGSEE